MNIRDRVQEKFMVHGRAFEQVYQTCAKIRHVRMSAGSFYRVVEAESSILSGLTLKSSTKNINNMQFPWGGGARVAIPSKLKSDE
jgi:hypothetical protein